MDNLNMNAVLAFCGAVGVVGGAVLTVQKIINNIRRARKQRDLEVLQKAKESIVSVKSEIQSEVDDLKNELKLAEQEMGHLKETYNNEIKNLGTKIEELREQLRTEHGQLVQLLTKMVDSRD